MQPTGGVVGTATELAAGVELGEHNLDSSELCLLLDVDGDPAAVVGDLCRAIGVERDDDGRAMAAESFVDGVVDDLPQAMHEAAAVIGPDIHAGALAHRLEALEDRQVLRGVALAGILLRARCSR